MTTIRLDRPLIAVSAAAQYRDRWARRYLLFLACVLAGYALDGRGFAYLGVPPLFIAEITLLCGLAVLAMLPRWFPLLNTPPMIVLLLLVAWGVTRTVPYLHTYGLMALRDAVVYGYSAFAFILGGILLYEPGSLRVLLQWYRRFVPLFLLGIIVVTIIYRFLYPTIPRWPWGDIVCIHEKEGDVEVHLCWIFAFWASGLCPNPRLIWVVLLTATLAFMSGIERAGMVAFALVASLCLFLRPQSAVPWRMAAICALAAVVLWATHFRLDIPGGKGRDLSFDGLVHSVQSIFHDTGDEGMDANKAWRLNWWNDIIGYTFHGRYFWTGKGFGINLADDDGYQVLHDATLRAPHSAHMSLLARTGVPGLALWVLLQATWGAYVAIGYFRARRAGRRQWAGVFLFMLCGWMACLVNGSFDVYIEGPMGGVWFWSLFGAGAAARRLFDTKPEVLRDQ